MHNNLDQCGKCFVISRYLLDFLLTLIAWTYTFENPNQILNFLTHKIYIFIKQLEFCVLRFLVILVVCGASLFFTMRNIKEYKEATTVTRPKLSLNEFRIRLEVIRNSTKNVDFEIRIQGRIWFINSNVTEFDGRF